MDITVSKKKATLTKDPNVLAGSIVTMDECFRNFIKFTNGSVCDACRAASEHPAKALYLVLFK